MYFCGELSFFRKCNFYFCSTKLASQYSAVVEKLYQMKILISIYKALKDKGKKAEFIYVYTYTYYTNRSHVYTHAHIYMYID